MVKKILLILLILLIASVAAFFIWRYVNYTRDNDPYKTFLLPRVEMSHIEITSITAEKTKMNAAMLIQNQLPFAFTADSFQYELYINDAQIMKSRYKKSITLASNDSSWITLPVTVYHHDIDSVIKANEKRNIDSVEYRMNASFYTDIIFQKKFDVSVKRYLPLFHLPDIKTENIDVDSLNFKRAALLVHIALTNNNVFDIRVKDYAFEIQIEDHEVITGTIKGLTVAKAKETTAITIPLRLSFKEVGKTLWELLKKGSNVNYKLHLTLKIDSDNNMMKDSKVVVEASGSVKALLKAVKGEPEEKKKKKDK